MDPEKDHTVAAKVRTGGPARGHRFLDLNSRDAGWSILVLDEQLQPIIQRFGARKQDAWEQVERDLRSRGLIAVSP
jgi:hypothetical protein